MLHDRMRRESIEAYKLLHGKLVVSRGRSWWRCHAGFVMSAGWQPLIKGWMAWNDGFSLARCWDWWKGRRAWQVFVRLARLSPA